MLLAYLGKCTPDKARNTVYRFRQTKIVAKLAKSCPVLEKQIYAMIENQEAKGIIIFVVKF